MAVEKEKKRPHRKKIEDILLDEQPHRYVVNGLRNWLQLNKDVALLQSKLKGTLPTRGNVMSLLPSVVINSSLEGRDQVRQSQSETLLHYVSTDHRMLPQKRILEKDYSIVFPSKKLCPDESDVVMLSDDQQIADFKLALKLQQDELESPAIISTVH
jgi:hypothetical protein